MTITNLVRPEIRHLRGYESEVQTSGVVRLHANEVPWAIEAGGDADKLNRYPEIRPKDLQLRLAEHFGVSAQNLLVTRGSSEAIDLLIRTFCRAGLDNIVITPPTFAMFKVYADIQGAATISWPLPIGEGFALDANALVESCTTASKLIFVCSPNNPTGNVIPRADILCLLQAREDQSIVVVDEAYIEFSDSESLVDLVGEYENLVVLRTLSKALALAGARCGAVIGSADLIRILQGVLTPYALATPVIDSVMRALSSEESTRFDLQISEIVAERERLHTSLAIHRLIQKVWPSQANFLLVKFHDLDDIQRRLQHERILIRDWSSQPGLENCARITVGTPADNARLLAALQ